MVQFVGIPFAFAFGALAGRIGAKPSIFLALVVYVLISIVGLLHDDGVAVLPAGVPGGDGAGRQPGAVAVAVREHDPAAQVVGVLRLLRRLREVRRRSSGPALFAITVRYTGSSRNAILSVIAFFVVGAILLWRVDVERGQQMARAAEQGH